MQEEIAKQIIQEESAKEESAKEEFAKEVEIDYLFYFEFIR